MVKIRLSSKFKSPILFEGLRLTNSPLSFCKRPMLEAEPPLGFIPFNLNTLQYLRSPTCSLGKSQIMAISNAKKKKSNSSGQCLKSTIYKTWLDIQELFP